MNVLKEKVTDFFITHLELNVSRYDDAFLKNSLQKRISASGCSTMDEYIDLLTQTDLESILLLDTLQVSYSTFFRNPFTYNVLEKIVFPELLKRKKEGQIRIWSAACAAGQEAYSLAMLIESLLKVDERKNRYQIFATDKDENQIHMAHKGHFHVSALDNISMKLVREWFKRLGEIYTIKTELRHNIDFSVFDLFDEKHSSPPSSIFGDFDIVFCANLLFYYKTGFRKKIIDKIIGSMSKDGLLITGETEREILLGLNFKEVYPRSAIFSLK